MGSMRDKFSAFQTLCMNTLLLDYLRSCFSVFCSHYSEYLFWQTFLVHCVSSFNVLSLDVGTSKLFHLLCNRNCSFFVGLEHLLQFNELLDYYVP